MNLPEPQLDSIEVVSPSCTISENRRARWGAAQARRSAGRGTHIDGSTLALWLRNFSFGAAPRPRSWKSFGTPARGSTAAARQPNAVARNCRNGPRTLAIVDAFDSMTTPQVYRPAMSRDRAIQELCDFAGSAIRSGIGSSVCRTQYRSAAPLPTRGPALARHLSPATANGWWQWQPQGKAAADAGIRFAAPAEIAREHVRRRDFSRRQSAACRWNRGAERLTGIPAASILQRLFTPSGLKIEPRRARQ